MSKEIRILIVDDHFIVRHGLRTILADHCPSATFGEASSAHSALELAWREKWDVVLLDVSMPGRGGLEVLKDLRKSFPKLPVLVVSMHPEEQFALRVLKLGACGYVRKDSAGHELTKAVDAALRGSRYITPSIAEQLAVNLERDKEGPTHESLSDREYQVLCMLCVGKTVKEVGGELSLSVKTISTYRSRILEKLKLENNAQLMRYAFRHGLIDVDG